MYTSREKAFLERAMRCEELLTATARNLGSDYDADGEGWDKIPRIVEAIRTDRMTIREERDEARAECERLRKVAEAASCLECHTLCAGRKASNTPCVRCMARAALAEWEERR